VNAKFLNCRMVNGELVGVFSMPMVEVLDLQQRFGGDKEDASKLLDALMEGVYAAFPHFPRDKEQENPS
jgi:hypothetical protein